MKKRYSFGPETCDWIEGNCAQPSGPNQGEPFVLMPWQREFIYQFKESDANGNLRYRWALLGLAKGNGKTPLAAALACHHVFGEDVTDPWAVFSATSDKQANIGFDAVRQMIERSPSLSKRASIFRSEIQVHGGGKIERVAASRGKLDGKIISFLVVDELHEWAEENWTILTGGAMKRPDSQILQITTAGYDLETICGKEYEKGRRIEAGEAQNPTYLFRWYAPPNDAGILDRSAWLAANPSMGTIVYPEILADLAINQPEADFRRYRLNQWVASQTAWLPFGAWEKCRLSSIDPATGEVTNPKAALIPGEPFWAGWDASTKSDTTAIVCCQWQEIDGKRRLVLVNRAWERPMLPDGNPDESWRLPIGEVEEYIRELHRIKGLQEVAYDPAFITWSAAGLMAAGIPMVEWPQTSDGRMVPATQAFYEVVTPDPILAHDGDRILARHVANVVAYQTRQGGQRLGKGRQRKAIDCAIATLMAIGAMRSSAPKPAAPRFFSFGAELQEVGI